MKRRRFIKYTALAGATLSAGCLGGSGSNSDGSGGGSGDGKDGKDSSGDKMSGDGKGGSMNDSGDGMDSGDGSDDSMDSSDGSGDGSGDGGTSMTFSYNHASTKGIKKQPFLGPKPTKSEAVIVAYEDVSCPRCASFEKGTLPTLKSRVTDKGKATFVYRNFPVVYEWGKPAAQALEAVYARDEKAFWGLKDFYFSGQDRFNPDNVLTETKKFIEADTDLDPDAVISDARNKKYNSAVQLDLDAGKNAGARGTPTFFLFKKGKLVTKLSGAQNYAVFKNALNL